MASQFVGLLPIGDAKRDHDAIVVASRSFRLSKTNGIGGVYAVDSYAPHRRNDGRDRGRERFLLE